MPFLLRKSGADFHHTSAKRQKVSCSPDFSHLATLRAWPMRRWRFLRQSGVLSREKDGKRDRFLERERRSTRRARQLYICMYLRQRYRKMLSEANFWFHAQRSARDYTVAQSVAMVTREAPYNNRPRKHIMKAPPSFLSHEPRHFSVFVSLSGQCNGARSLSHSARSSRFWLGGSIPSWCSLSFVPGSCENARFFHHLPTFSPWKSM